MQGRLAIGGNGDGQWGLQWGAVVGFLDTVVGFAAGSAESADSAYPRG